MCIIETTSPFPVFSNETSGLVPGIRGSSANVYENLTYARTLSAPMGWQPSAGGTPNAGSGSGTWTPGFAGSSGNPPPGVPGGGTFPGGGNSGNNGGPGFPGGGGPGSSGPGGGSGGGPGGAGPGGSPGGGGGGGTSPGGGAPLGGNDQPGPPGVPGGGNGIQDNCMTNCQINASMCPIPTIDDDGVPGDDGKCHKPAGSGSAPTALPNASAMTSGN